MFILQGSLTIVHKHIRNTLEAQGQKLTQSLVTGVKWKSLTCLFPSGISAPAERCANTLEGTIALSCIFQLWKSLLFAQHSWKHFNLQFIVDWMNIGSICLPYRTYTHSVTSGLLGMQGEDSEQAVGFAAWILALTSTVSLKVFGPSALLLQRHPWFAQPEPILLWKGKLVQIYCHVAIGRHSVIWKIIYILHC